MNKAVTANSILDDIFGGGEGKTSSPVSVSTGSTVDTGSLIDKYSQQFGVDTSLVKALTHTESGGKANATSYKGAGGLMQIMPATAKEIASELGETYSPEKLYDPDTNVRWGTYLLAKNLKEFGGDERKAVAAYHAGVGAVKAANAKGQEIPNTSDGLSTTTDYVNNIMSLRGDSSNISGSAPAPSADGNYQTADQIINDVFGSPDPSVNPANYDFNTKVSHGVTGSFPEPEKHTADTIINSVFPELANSNTAQIARTGNPEGPSQLPQGAILLPTTIKAPDEDTQRIYDQFANAPSPEIKAAVLTSLPMDKAKELFQSLPEDQMPDVAAQIEAMRKKGNVTESFALGLVKSTPATLLMPEASKNAIDEKMAKYPIAGAAGEMVGTVAQMAGTAGAAGAVGLGSKVASFIKNPVLQKVVSNAVVAATSGAAVTGAQQVDPVVSGKESIKEALLNTAESGAGNAIGVVPGIVMGKNALRLLADPAANVLFQLGDDAARGRDMTDKSAMTRYAAAALFSAGGSLVDMHTGESYVPGKGESVDSWIAKRPDSQIEVTVTQDNANPSLDFGAAKKEVPDYIMNRKKEIERKLSGITNEADRKDVAEQILDEHLGEYGVTSFKDASQTMRQLEALDIPFSLERGDGLNLGGANKKLQHSGADNAMKEVWGKVWAVEVQKAGGIPFRGTGDELKAIWPNKTAAEVKAIRKPIDEMIDAKVKELGYDKIPHTKGEYGGMPTGAMNIHYGVSDHIPGKFGEMDRIADNDAELMKNDYISKVAKENGYSFNQEKNTYEYTGLSPEKQSSTGYDASATSRISTEATGGAEPANLADAAVPPSSRTRPQLSHAEILSEIDSQLPSAYSSSPHLGAHTTEVDAYSHAKALSDLVTPLRNTLDASSFGKAGETSDLINNSRWFAPKGQGVSIDEARNNFLSTHGQELQSLGIDPETIQTPSDFIGLLDKIPTQTDLTGMRKSALASLSEKEALHSQMTDEFYAKQKEGQPVIDEKTGDPAFWDDNTPEPQTDLSANSVDDWETFSAKIDKPEPVKNNTPVVENLSVADKIKNMETPAGQVAAGGISMNQKVPSHAGNINLDNVEAPEDLKRLMVNKYGEYQGKIDEATRGKITQEATRELADLSGITANKLLRRKKGEVWNAEQTLAARDIYVASAKKLQSTMDAVYAKPRDQITDKDLLDLNLQMRMHAAIHAEVAGLTAESGRLLNSFKIMSQAKKEGQSATNLLAAANGRDVNMDMLDRLKMIDPNNTAALGQFIQKSMFAKTKDAVYEYWINAILSNPKTHAANIASNSLTTISRTLLEKPVAAGVEAVRAGVTGKPRERFFREIPAEIVGSLTGIQDALTAFSHTFKTGVSTLGNNKDEIVRDAAIPGIAGKIIRTPTRLLAAADDFFKTVVFRGEVSALAYRQARTEGLKTEAEIGKRMDEIRNNLDDHPKIRDAAWKEAQYRTFTKPLGNIGQKIVQLRDASEIAKYIVPFVKTPTNVMKYALERAPGTNLAILAKKAKDGMTGAQTSDQIAKTLVGTALAVPLAMWAKAGLITGSGPKDNKERDALRRNGWQPYSIKIGDKYLSYNRMEPFGSQMGLIADFASMPMGDLNSEEETNRKNVANQIAYSLANNVTNKTFMQQLSNLNDAMSDPGRYGSNFTNRMATSLVPNIVAGVAGATDQTVRTPKNLAESYKMRVPGMTDQATAKLNIWGEEVKKDGAAAYRFTVPADISTAKNSPVDKEIVRLGMAPAMPARYITERGKRIDLTSEQYAQFVKESGAKAKESVEALIELPFYKGLSDEDKKKEIESRISKARSIVKNRMF